MASFRIGWEQLGLTPPTSAEQKTPPWTHVTLGSTPATNTTTIGASAAVTLPRAILPLPRAQSRPANAEVIEISDSDEEELAETTVSEDEPSASTEVPIVRATVSTAKRRDRSISPSTYRPTQRFRPATEATAANVIVPVAPAPAPAPAPAVIPTVRAPPPVPAPAPAPAVVPPVPPRPPSSSTTVLGWGVRLLHGVTPPGVPRGTSKYVATTEYYPIMGPSAAAVQAAQRPAAAAAATAAPSTSAPPLPAGRQIPATIETRAEAREVAKRQYGPRGARATATNKGLRDRLTEIPTRYDPKDVRPAVKRWNTVVQQRAATRRALGAAESKLQKLEQARLDVLQQFHAHHDELGQREIALEKALQDVTHAFHRRVHAIHQEMFALHRHFRTAPEAAQVYQRLATLRVEATQAQLQCDVQMHAYYKLDDHAETIAAEADHDLLLKLTGGHRCPMPDCTRHIKKPLHETTPECTDGHVFHRSAFRVYPKSDKFHESVYHPGLLRTCPVCTFNPAFMQDVVDDYAFDAISAP